MSDFSIVRQSSESILLRKGDMEALVKKYWFGEKRRWLLTAFQKKVEPVDETIDTTNSNETGREDDKLSSKGSDNNVEQAGENVNSTFSVRSAADREKFHEALDNRIQTDPEVYEPIWNDMRGKVQKVQDDLTKLATTDSRDATKPFEQSFREQGLVEINAVINSLPKDLRGQFTRNWRNPYSGEAGNIFTKYSSLTSDAERNDFLIKTVAKAKDAPTLTR